jgi:hypothetical protein
MVAALAAAGLLVAVTMGGTVASGAAPPGVAYGGETSQHDQAFFLLSSTRHSLKRIALDWDGSCGGEDDFTVNATLGTVQIKPDGTFARTARSTEEGDNPGWSDYWTEQITGRMASDRITGTFRGHLITRRANGSLVRECDSGPVTFQALQ